MRVPIDQIGTFTKLKWQTNSDIKADESRPLTGRRFEQTFCAALIVLIFAIVAVLVSLIAAS